jgi:hypothetical protein
MMMKKFANISKSLQESVSVKVLVLGVLFFAIANPMTYDLVDSLGLVSVKDGNGPSQLGVGIHSVVFMILVFVIAQMGKK